MSNFNLQSMRNLIKSNNFNISEVISILNITKENGDEENITELLEELGYETRICSVCNKIILQGYCIEGGYKYACDDRCLEEIMTNEEFKYLFNDGNGESYYTDFTEVDRTGIPYDNNPFYLWLENYINELGIDINTEIAVKNDEINCKLSLETLIKTLKDLDREKQTNIQKVLEYLSSYKSDILTFFKNIAGEVI